MENQYQQQAILAYFGQLTSAFSSIGTILGDVTLSSDEKLNQIGAALRGISLGDPAPQMPSEPAPQAPSGPTGFPPVTANAVSPAAMQRYGDFISQIDGLNPNDYKSWSWGTFQSVKHRVLSTLPSNDNAVEYKINELRTAQSRLKPKRRRRVTNDGPADYRVLGPIWSQPGGIVRKGVTIAAALTSPIGAPVLLFDGVVTAIQKLKPVEKISGLCSRIGNYFRQRRENNQYISQMREGNYGFNNGPAQPASFGI